MSLIFTSSMAKRLTPRVRCMLEDSLFWFPELEGKNITVGYTRSRGSLGAAYMPANGIDGSMGIRLKVRNLVYNTIGHELTHLAQGLSQTAKKQSTREGKKIPGGEKQCDIWTLARSELFCDDAPTYIRLPREVRENWPRYALAVRSLCIAAIEKRRNYRFYIRWLEDQIRQLVQKRRQEADRAEPIQGCLPRSEKRDREK